jgi:hypothetical protein
MSTEWFYIIGEHEHGPIKGKALKRLAKVGQITSNTLVRKATSKRWTEAHHVKQLFDAHNSSQQAFDAPPRIGQSSQAEREKAVSVQPPPHVHAVTEPSPIIPTAELAPPESDAFTPQINIITTPNLNEATEDGNPNSNNADDDHLKNNDNSKRPLTLVLILVGLIILTIPIAWYLNREPATTAGNATAQVNHPPAANADLSAASNSRSETNQPPSRSPLINNVFTKLSLWIDPTNNQFLVTRDARLSITHVWLDTQQPEQPILKIVVNIENRNPSTELSLQRQFANQNASDRPHELSPYLPLIRLSTGDGRVLDPEVELVNRTIPRASKISETYQIALTTQQAAELNQLQVAVPKAWFNKSGYWGFKIPQVMITSTKPVTTKPAQPPVQIASEPDSASGNVSNAQGSNVGGESSPSTKHPADGKGILPPSPFGNNTTTAKPKNGVQPTTILELQSQIDQEKKRVPEPRSDELPQ